MQNIWRARTDRILNNTIAEVEEISEAIKLLFWRWFLSRLAFFTNGVGTQRSAFCGGWSFGTFLLTVMVSKSMYMPASFFCFCSCQVQRSCCFCFRLRFLLVMQVLLCVVAVFFSVLGGRLWGLAVWGFWSISALCYCSLHFSQIIDVVFLSQIV